MPLSFQASYPARPASVPLLRRAVAQALASAEVERMQAVDVLVALTEAVANAALHAYPGKEGWVRVRLEADGGLLVEVSDQGRAMQPWDETRGAQLGMPLIAALATQVHVESSQETGTLVRMVFSRPPTREA